MHTCASTGRLNRSRKVSLSRLLNEFKYHVHIDYFFIAEFDNKPIIHMVNTASSFSVAVFIDNRRLDLAAKAFEKSWSTAHGPPAMLSADLEFLGEKFTDTLK